MAGSVARTGWGLIPACPLPACHREMEDGCHCGLMNGVGRWDGNGRRLLGEVHRKAFRPGGSHDAEGLLMADGD